MLEFHAEELIRFGSHPGQRVNPLELDPIDANVLFKENLPVIASWEETKLQPESKESSADHIGSGLNVYTDIKTVSGGKRNFYNSRKKKIKVTIE